MKKSLSLLLGALLSASQAWAGGLSGSAGGLSGGVATGITAGTTTTTCSALQLFYADSSSKFACAAGSSWDNATTTLTITGGVISVSNVKALSSLNLGSTGQINFFSSASGVLTLRNAAQNSFTSLVLYDTYITRKTTASLQLGSTDAASPVAQTLGVQGSTGTNVAAAATFTIKGPLATGNAAPGDIVIQTGVVGASGTTASTATTALTIKGATQNVIAAAQLVPGSGTKAQMDALTGVEGGLFNVTDQLTACPAKGAGFTGGGTVTCLAHFEEGAWVAP